MSGALLFVEDPGAANFVADVPAALRERGLGAVLVAAGAAGGYLAGYDRRLDRSGLDVVDALLDEVVPDVVVVGTAENRDTAGLDLVDAARARGLPTVGVVDGPDNASYRFRGRGDHALAHAPDWVLVADAWTRSCFVELGLPADRIVVTGHPLYDRVRDAALAPAAPSPWPDAPDGVPVLLFAAERSDGLPSAQFRRTADYSLVGRGSDRRTDVVIEELLDAVASLDRRVFTVLRLHPKNDSDEFARHAAEFDAVSTGGPAFDVLRAADIVVGMTSVLLDEAVLLGRPTLSIVPRPQEADLSTSVRLGLVQCTWTRKAVRSAVAAMVASPTPPDRDEVATAFPPGGTAHVADAVVAVATGVSPA